jgi:hypothetical protein
MSEILLIPLFFAVLLLVSVLFLYFVKFVIGRMEKYFLTREEVLIVIGVALMAVGIPFGVGILFGAGAGILFADWILNWERIVERYGPKKES